MSDRRVDVAREKFKADAIDDLDVIGFGSLGRREVTEESDFDYLVLATGLPHPTSLAQDLLASAAQLALLWANEEGRSEPVKGPGSSGLFGVAVGAFDMVDQIGLQGDTNHSLTRRMLLLSESISLRNPDIHEEVLRATMSRYLEVGHEHPDRPPRFLLNDLVRYWRTITVDFQAKARNEESVSALRYLKLIISRKLLFAGTVMSLLLCGKPGFHQAVEDDLFTQFSMPPLDRLLQGRHHATPAVESAMEVVLEVAETFLLQSSSSEWRNAVKETDRSRPETRAQFDEMKGHADRLQSALELIFLDWELVREDSRRMLVF